MKQAVTQLLCDVVDEFNAVMNQERPLEKRPDEILFGEGGVLDSLGLVNLITMIESRVEDELNLSITIADDKAMSRKASPFRSLGALSDFLCEILKTYQHG